MGGGGSGKSIFVGQKIIERCVREPGHMVLVFRKVERSVRKSCFEQMKNQVMQLYPDEVEMIPKGESSGMYIKFKNGSTIYFSGMD